MYKHIEAILTELLEPFRPVPDEENPEAPLLLLAVSGGMDSMCLADMVHRCKSFPFAIAHCNFQLRDEEADEDEAFVRKWTARRKIPLHTIRFDTRQRAAERNISIEMAARELRYEWFRDLCRENGYIAVATAHNANDNAETLLLNLLRGTGIKGMLGMSMSTSLPLEDGEDIPLLRPLLRIPREEIETYVRRNKVPYREDRTNAEDIYRRNRIRNEVFPQLKAINPSFVFTFAEDMDRLRTVDAIADDYYRIKRSSCYDGESIDIDKLRSTPNWEYILYRILIENGFTPSEAQLAEDLLKGGRQISGTTIGSGEKVLYGAYGKLVISEPRDFWDDDEKVEVTGPGSYGFGKVRILITEEPWDSRTMSARLDPAERTLIADARTLPFPFILRGWLPGDYIRPLGLRGRKKVQDLFTDLKLSLDQKHDTPVLVKPDCYHGDRHSGFRDHVSAVLPYRIDEKLAVSEKTVRIVRLVISSEK